MMASASSGVPVNFSGLFSSARIIVRLDERIERLGSRRARTAIARGFAPSGEARGRFRRRARPDRGRRSAARESRRRAAMRRDQVRRGAAPDGGGGGAASRARGRARPPRRRRAGARRRGGGGAADSGDGAQRRSADSRRRPAASRSASPRGSRGRHGRGEIEKVRRRGSLRPLRPDRRPRSSGARGLADRAPDVRAHRRRCGPPRSMPDAAARPALRPRPR